jgi:hypothetical protein
MVVDSETPQLLTSSISRIYPFGPSEVVIRSVSVESVSSHNCQNWKLWELYQRIVMVMTLSNPMTLLLILISSCCDMVFNFHDTSWHLHWDWLKSRSHTFVPMGWVCARARERLYYGIRKNNTCFHSCMHTESKMCLHHSSPPCTETFPRLQTNLSILCSQ